MRTAFVTVILLCACLLVIGAREQFRCFLGGQQGGCTGTSYCNGDVYHREGCTIQCYEIGSGGSLAESGSAICQTAAQ